MPWCPSATYPWLVFVRRAVEPAPGAVHRLTKPSADQQAPDPEGQLQQQREVWGQVWGRAPIGPVRHWSFFRAPPGASALPLISKQQVRGAVFQLRVRIAAGVDNLSPHVIRSAPGAFFAELAVLMNEVEKASVAPAGWRGPKVIVCPTPGGDGCDP